MFCCGLCDDKDERINIINPIILPVNDLNNINIVKHFKHTKKRKNIHKYTYKHTIQYSKNLNKNKKISLFCCKKKKTNKNESKKRI